METELNEEWTAEVVGRMHRCRIRSVELADRCGYSAPYLSTVLNCKKHFESEESKERTKKRIFACLGSMENEILAGR